MRKIDPASLNDEEASQLKMSYRKDFNGGYYDAKTPEILELAAQDRSSKIFIGRKMFDKYNYNKEEMREIKNTMCHHGLKAVV